MKSRNFLGAILAFSFTFVATGCDTGGLKEEILVVKPENDPLHVPRQILAAYTQGKVLGQEVETFEGMVKKVRERDVQRADVLEKGFAELQQASDPEAFKAKAAEILAKIQPTMGIVSEDGTSGGYPVP